MLHPFSWAPLSINMAGDVVLSMKPSCNCLRQASPNPSSQSCPTDLMKCFALKDLSHCRCEAIDWLSTKAWFQINPLPLSLELLLKPFCMKRSKPNRTAAQSFSPIEFDLTPRCSPRYSHCCFRHLHMSMPWWPRMDTQTLPWGLIDDNREHPLIDPLWDWPAYSYVPNNCIGLLRQAFSLTCMWCLWGNMW